MSVGIGMRGFLAFGEESTYGTVVPRPYFLEFNSESLMVEEPKIKTGALIRRGYRNTKVGQGGISVAGSIEFEAGYGGWLKLAKHAFGRVDTISLDPTNVPTAKRHTFSITDLPPTGLSVEVFRDTTDFATESLKSFIYTGCKIGSIDFSCGVDEILKVSMALIGQNESRGTYSSPQNFSNDKFALYHQGSLLWGSDLLPIESFRVTLNNALAPRTRMGSRLTREPYPDNMVEVSGTFTIEFDTWSQYDDFRAATERTLDVNFQGDNIGSSIYKNIRLLCNVGQLTAVRPQLNSRGRIKMDVDFEAYRSAAANELELQVINTETGI